MEHKWSTDSLDEQYVVISSFPKVRSTSSLEMWIGKFLQSTAAVTGIPDRFAALSPACQPVADPKAQFD